MKCGVKRLCPPEGHDPVLDIIGQHIPGLEIERFTNLFRNSDLALRGESAELHR